MRRDAIGESPQDHKSEPSSSRPRETEGGSWQEDAPRAGYMWRRFAGVMRSNARAARGTLRSGCQRKTVCEAGDSPGKWAPHRLSPLPADP